MVITLQSRDKSSSVSERKINRAHHITDPDFRADNCHSEVASYIRSFGPETSKPIAAALSNHPAIIADLKKSAIHIDEPEVAAAIDEDHALIPCSDERIILLATGWKDIKRNRQIIRDHGPWLMFVFWGLFEEDKDVIRLVRLRPAEPITWKESSENRKRAAYGKPLKSQKYVTRKGDTNYPFYPRSAPRLPSTFNPESWRTLPGNNALKCIWTEGEKKAISAWYNAGIPTLGAVGVYGHRMKDVYADLKLERAKEAGHSSIHDDDRGALAPFMHQINWCHIKPTVIYDSDLATNDSVRKAMNDFASRTYLQDCEEVRVAFIAGDPNKPESKLGIDDLLMLEQGIKTLRDLIRTAKKVRGPDNLDGVVSSIKQQFGGGGSSFDVRGLSVPKSDTVVPIPIKHNRCSICNDHDRPCQTCFERFVGTGIGARIYNTKKCLRGRAHECQRKKGKNKFITVRTRCNLWTCEMCGPFLAFEYLSHLKPAFASIAKGTTKRFSKCVDTESWDVPCHDKVVHQVIPIQYRQGYTKKLANLGVVSAVKILAINGMLAAYGTMPPGFDINTLTYTPKEVIGYDWSRQPNRGEEPVTFAPIELDPSEAWEQIRQGINRLGVSVKVSKARSPAELWRTADSTKPFKPRGNSGVGLTKYWAMPLRRKKSDKYDYVGPNVRTPEEKADFVRKWGGEVKEVPVSRVDTSHKRGWSPILVQLTVTEFPEDTPHAVLEQYKLWLTGKDKVIEPYDERGRQEHLETPARKICHIQSSMFT